jgi:hypothetical protein
LTRIYSWEEEVGYGSGEYERRYEREYDVQGRLTKTTVTYYDNGASSDSMVETYTEWTNVNTSVKEAGIDSRTPVAYYNIMGVKLQDAPEKGLYIVVYDNGSTEKKMK